MLLAYLLSFIEQKLESAKIAQSRSNFKLFIGTLRETDIAPETLGFGK